MKPRASVPRRIVYAARGEIPELPLAKPMRTSSAQFAAMLGYMLDVPTAVIWPDWTFMVPGANGGGASGGNGSAGSSWCQSTPFDVMAALVCGPGRPAAFATQILPLRTATLAMRMLKGVMKRGSPLWAIVSWVEL